MVRSTRHEPIVRTLIACALVACASGCGGDDEERATPAIQARPANRARDAGVDASHDAGPPRPPARLFAKRFVSKIRVRPDRESFRVGYLRAGAVVMATTAEPVRTDDPRCRGGWYELTTGGFVCNGRDVIAFWGRRLPHARGAQPDRDAPLPYRYGRNRRPNAPMYRRLPTDEEAVEHEGFRIPGAPTPEEIAAGDETAAGASAETATAQAATAQTATAQAATAQAATAQAATPSGAAQDSARAADPPAAGAPAPTADGEVAEEGDVVTLESLQGDPNSALMRRLVSGFIVSLDRDFRAGPHGRRYWRTINNGFVPYAAVGTIRGPEFSGVRLDDVSRLPIGFVLERNAIFFTRDGERARRGRGVELRTALNIVGQETIGTTSYFVAADGRLYRERDVRQVLPRARPPEIGPQDKWIEVNLTEQYLIAYEGDRPVYGTLTSTGRAHHPDDPNANYLTPPGLYRIRAKHLAAAMDGDTAADGPYSIDDVPWVMYFQLAYALHGAFWHNGFGYPRSHGCVNLAPADARWIFDWSDPPLPEGWHGAYPTEQNPGTWIFIHGETPGSAPR